MSELVRQLNERLAEKDAEIERLRAGKEEALDLLADIVGEHCDSHSEPSPSCVYCAAVAIIRDETIR